MKKSLIILAAAAIALAGCAKSEVLKIAQDRVIGFEPFVENQTKAVDDITDGSADFKEFYVFGEKATKNNSDEYVPDGTLYLSHVQVTGGKGNWTYSPHVPWIANSRFRFAAYANGKGDGISTAARLENVEFRPATGEQQNWGLDITNYTVGDDDLIIAIPGEKVVDEIESSPASVGLTFKHVLSKVIFQFRYSANTNNQTLKLEINPFEFQAFNKGNCTATYTGDETTTKIGAEWTIPTGTALHTYEFFAADAEGNNQTWTSGNIQSEMYVIPQTNSGVVIDEIVIHSKNGNDEITNTTTYDNVSLTIPSHTFWKPGYVYRYIADIIPGEHYIHFTTSVTAWVDEDNRNQTIQSGASN